MIKILVIIFVIFSITHCYSVETCSRIAIINYQEILIDTNTTQKGEGLRYHLEKDPIALKYLNAYQEGTKTKLANIAIGTAGSLLVISGALVHSSDTAQQYLIATGLVTLAVNFIIAKALSSKNEQNLLRAVDEYNKRNLPRVHYGTDLRNARGPSGFSLNFTRSF